MANSLPCPNPVCSHVFSAAEIQSASAIKCPRCGFVFQFRAKPTAPAAAARPQPQAPPARTAPVPPPAVPKKPASGAVRKPPPRLAAPVAPPIAKVVAPPLPPPTRDPALEKTVDLNPPAPPSPKPGDAGLDFASEGPLLRRRQLPRSSSFGNWVMLIVGPLLLIAILVGGFFAVQHFGTGGGDSGGRGPVDEFTGRVRTAKKTDEIAYRLLLPKTGWSKDSERGAGLGANVWKHDKEAFWFAIDARDFGLYRPRDAELLDRGLEKLEKFFGAENLELAAKAEPATVGDLPALSLTFKGTLNVVWWGEMKVLAHHGFGYWLVTFAPTLQEAQDQWRDLQSEHSGLKIITDRKGWREQPPKMENFNSDSGALAVTGPEGVWTREEAQKIAERGELYLFGRYRKEKDNRKNAEVLIVNLDSVKGDLKEMMKTARDYYQTKKQEEEDKSYNVAVAEEGQSEFGVEETFGNKKGRVLELKLSRGDEAKRYIILAVAAGQNFLVQCDCTWEARQIWRQDFLELLRTMKVKARE